MGCAASTATSPVSAKNAKGAKGGTKGGTNAAMERAKERRLSMKITDPKALEKKEALRDEMAKTKELRKRRKSTQLSAADLPTSAQSSTTGGDASDKPVRRRSSITGETDLTRSLSAENSPQRPPRRLSRIEQSSLRRSKSSEDVKSASLSTIPNSEHDFTRPEKKRDGHTNLNKLVKKGEMVAL